MIETWPKDVLGPKKNGNTFTAVLVHTSMVNHKRCCELTNYEEEDYENRRSGISVKCIPHIVDNRLNHKSLVFQKLSLIIHRCDEIASFPCNKSLHHLKQCIQGVSFFQDHDVYD